MHIAHLLCQFCLSLISPNRIRKNYNQSQDVPGPRPAVSQCRFLNFLIMYQLFSLSLDFIALGPAGELLGNGSRPRRVASPIHLFDISNRLGTHHSIAIPSSLSRSRVSVDHKVSFDDSKRRKKHHYQRPALGLNSTADLRCMQCPVNMCMMNAPKDSC